jgi:hypothetical protein
MMIGDLELEKEKMEDEILYLGHQYIEYLIQYFMHDTITIIESLRKVFINL